MSIIQAIYYIGAVHFTLKRGVEKVAFKGILTKKENFEFFSKKVLTKGWSDDIINKLTRERGGEQRSLKKLFEKNQKRY